MNRRGRCVTAFCLGLCVLTGGMAAEGKKNKTAEKPGRLRDKKASAEKRPPAPQVGDEAPLFSIKTLDEKSNVALKDFRGKKPVILFFGSYT